MKEGSSAMLTLELFATCTGLAQLLSTCGGEGTSGVGWHSQCTCLEGEAGTLVPCIPELCYPSHGFHTTFSSHFCMGDGLVLSEPLCLQLVDGRG